MPLTPKQKTDQRRDREIKKGRKRRELSLTDKEFKEVKQFIKAMRKDGT